MEMLLARATQLPLFRAFQVSLHGHPHLASPKKKKNKETHCLLETVTFFFPSLFSKVLLPVNNHFEKCG